MYVYIYICVVYVCVLCICVYMYIVICVYIYIHIVYNSMYDNTYRPVCFGRFPSCRFAGLLFCGLRGKTRCRFDDVVDLLFCVCEISMLSVCCFAVCVEKLDLENMGPVPGSFELSKGMFSSGS